MSGLPRLPPAVPVLAALLAAGCSGEPARPRSVLLISIDSLRADHVSSAGYRSPTSPGVLTTPKIDRLLTAHGARFTHAVSTTSWTLPGHMAMLSGRPDELHGVRDLPDRLPASVPLVQEAFLAAGWRTAGFWSGPNLHPWFGFDRGFESYVDCSEGGVADPEAFGLAHPEADQAAVMAAHDASHSGITGPKVVDAFTDWFAGIDDSEPFFAFVHLWDVHYDYEPPPEFDVFDPTYRGKVTGRDYMNLRIRAGAQRDLDHLIALYDGEIRFTDTNVARILERLDAAGRLADTLVVLTADHREAFAEHRMLGHKHSLPPDEDAVPLVVFFPGRVPAGREVNAPVSLVDIAPTLLDFADLPPLEGQWGRSLVPLATGELDALPERPMPLELTARYDGRYQRGARWSEASVIRKTDGELRLFDLERDPFEQRAQKNPRPSSRLAEAEALWAELDAGAPTTRAQEALPEDLESDLSAAGYTEGKND
jgi:arylsulfatase A-like enzyme